MQDSLDRFRAYLKAQSSGIGRYLAEETLSFFTGWIPTPAGIAVRAVLWRLLVKGTGTFASDRGVILKNTKYIVLDRNVFLDRGVYLHGGKKHLKIGENTRVMFGAEVNVYNFRGLKDAFVEIGPNCVVGPYSVITGQGGVSIGGDVIIGPRVLILPVNHLHDREDLPIREQGLSLKGIRIESDVWIGGGAIILDGVKIGRGAVIGAGSVVVDDVPEQSVAAGNPARVIKRRDED